jgi:hypothetical protein
LEIARRSEANDFVGVLAQLFTGSGNCHRCWISCIQALQAGLRFYHKHPLIGRGLLQPHWLRLFQIAAGPMFARAKSPGTGSPQTLTSGGGIYVTI